MLVVMFADGVMVKTSEFGRLPDGVSAQLFHVTNAGLEATFTDFGARLVSLKTADRHGTLGSVVLGFASLADYVADTNTYMGAIAGRYANRIAAGRFAIDGKSYEITRNDKGNALHGGVEGFDRRIWQASILPDGIELTLVSPDGDQGFPGRLTLTVTYRLDGRSLRVEFRATTDAATVINATNHSYFNLAGAGSSTVLDHELTIPAGKFTPVNDALLPIGQLLDVSRTPFDFCHATRVGERIDQDDEQLLRAGGYDHNWVLGQAGRMKLAARLHEPVSGRVMTVETTEPGVQFYSGNFLGGNVHPRRSGLCLETQHYPDSPNHARFPTTMLRPGKTSQSLSIFTFSTEK